MRSLRQKFHLFLVRHAHKFLRRSGFVLLERAEWSKARIHAASIEARARRLAGGNASRYTFGERNKKLRRLARQFDAYLGQMDAPEAVR